MNNLKDNKKLIIMCLVLVLIVGVISYLVSNKEYFGEYIEYKENVIKKYDANQFIPVYITESDMANKYLNDFKYLMINDLTSAYNSLNKDYREKKYESYDDFVNVIVNKYSVQFYKMSVDRYAIVNKNGYKFYYIYDSSDNLYIFKELSIMNYEVFLDEYTVEVN